MGKGTALGKSILIGDQFVLEEVPAIVSSIPFETQCIVERRDDGEGWILEDNRTEVPGYKDKKKHQQVESINHQLEVMNIDVKKNPIKIVRGHYFFNDLGHVMLLIGPINTNLHIAVVVDDLPFNR